MTRLKFLAFALICLGLWAAALAVLSPAIGAAVTNQATHHATSAPAALALRLESHRSELQASVLKLASTPAVTSSKGAGKPEAPTADRFTQVRGAVMESVPEALKAVVVVGVVNEVGALMAQGSADPAAPAEGFDARAAGMSGGKGEVLEAFGSSHLFFAVPLFAVGGNEVRAVGSAFVGAPLVPDAKALVEAVARDLSLSALGLSAFGKVIAAGGPRRELIESVVAGAKPGGVKAAEKGAALELGPLKLPILTDGDPMGGGATLEVGVRRDIPGTPFEVIAVASSKPAMEALGGYQKTALLMFLGLLLAAIAFALLMGTAEAEEKYVPATAPAPAPVMTTSKLDVTASLPIADAPKAAEAHPDDFDFPASAPAVASAVAAEPAPAPAGSTQEAPRYEPPPVAEPAEDSFANLSPPVEAPPSAGMSLGEDDYESQRTTAYPAHLKNPMSIASTQSNPAVDPFALAGGALSAAEQAGENDNLDSTRVAAIPQELLAASARGNSQENPMGGLPKTLPRVAAVAPPSVAMAQNSGEDAHFQDVFRDFVAARERCGEPADGLTFEKFVTKLRKNKDQLVQKYNCKTVRFQVYVKEGKAALKATPVKE